MRKNIMGLKANTRPRLRRRGGVELGAGAMRVAAVIAVLVFAAAQVSALNIATDKKVYAKGEVISIEGLCSEGKNRLYAARERAVVFEREVVCEGAGYFKTSYETGYLDPSGQWEIFLENRGELAEARLSIAQVHESAYYVIRFLSPPGGSYERAGGITISVKVTDSGEGVADGRVFTWNAVGEKTMLENRGNGIYHLDYEIPYDASEGKWSVIVVAESGSGAEKRGGETAIGLAIEKAALGIEIIEPKARSFSLGSGIPLKVGASYSGGKAADAASGTVVSATLNGRETALTRDENGDYSGVLMTVGGDEGAMGIEIRAADSAGNSGSAIVNAVATGWAEWFVSTYAAYIIALVAALAFIAARIYGRAKRGGELESLEAEWAKNSELMKSLQDEYFRKGIMPAKAYKKMLAEYKARITRIEERIEELGTRGKKGGK
ncbi:MAG: hypothetical protein V1676_05105 [Candidatus Diapherotrites archaeon]